MESVYKVAGISKQAFHQQKKREEVFSQQLADLIVEVDQLRSEHPGCGI